MLIGLTGLAGSGKSAVAAVLIEELGFTRVKLADPLKNMVRTLLRDVGLPAEQAERYVEGDLKEAVVPGLGVTGRRLMQSLGTEWGRDAIRPTLWTDIFMERVRAAGDRVLCDDVRFPNEFDVVREAGGQIWRVDRPGLVAGDHPSERHVAGAAVDRALANVGTLADLRLMALGAGIASL